MTEMLNKRQHAELPFAMASNGRMVPVTEVANGLACDCRCPQRERRLVAKQGGVIRWHFAHEADADCQGAYETAIHKRAKQIIVEAGWVRTPDLTAYHPRRIQPVYPGLAFDLTDARAEAWMDGIRPDVAGMLRGRQAAIEVYVSHHCAPEKLTTFATRGIAAFEIDLHDAAIDAGFDRLVLERAPRSWLFNPDQAALDADLAAQFAAWEAEEVARVARAAREADEVVLARLRQEAAERMEQDRQRKMRDGTLWREAEAERARIRMQRLREESRPPPSGFVKSLACQCPVRFLWRADDVDRWHCGICDYPWPEPFRNQFIDLYKSPA